MAPTNLPLDADRLWADVMALAEITDRQRPYTRRSFTALFLEGRDLEFQIDYTSYLTTRKFATDNPALVRAVNDAFRAEGKWVSDNSKDAEYIAQKAGKYSDQVRDQFIAMDRKYRYFPVNDENFIAELQRAADWLVARKVLPEPVTITDHLAQL